VIVIDSDHGLTIHFADDIARGEAHIVGKAGGLDFGDQHTLLPFHTNALGLFGSEIFDAQAKFRRSGFVGSVVDAARGIREDMGAIFDGGTGFMKLFVAVIGDFDFAANRSGGNRIDEVIAGLDRSAVDGADDITALESSLFRGTAGFDGFNDYTVCGAEGLQSDLVRAEFLTIWS
jgi:hypothetical protein